MNNFTFTGRLGKDPEQRQTQSGKLLCNFTVGVRTTKKEGDYYATYWLNCQAWEQQARYILQNAKKGSFFTGSGEMRTDDYTGSDGQKKTYTYCLLREGVISTPATMQTSQPQTAPTAPAPQNLPPAQPAQVAPVAPTAPAPTVNTNEDLFGGTENVQLPFEI